MLSTSMSTSSVRVSAAVPGGAGPTHAALAQPEYPLDTTRLSTRSGQAPLIPPRPPASRPEAGPPTDVWCVTPTGSQKLDGLAQTTQELSSEFEQLKAQLAAMQRRQATIEMEAERLREQRDALANIGQACSRIDGFKALIGAMLDQARTLVGAQKGSLMLYDAKTDSLSVQVIRGVPDEVRQAVESGGFKFLTQSEASAGLPLRADADAAGRSSKCVTLKPGEGAAGRAYAGRHPVIVHDTNNDPRFVKPGASFTTDILCVPLVRPDGTCVGVLNMTNKVDGRQFSEEDARRMDAVCGPAALAVTNSKQQEQLQTDELTGVANRSALVHHLEEQLRSRGESGVSVLFVDIDKFKRFNDEYRSHDAGDAVLKEVARRLQEAVGDKGLVGRYGGDEFAVILPRSGRLMAASFAQQVREAVDMAPISAEGRRHSVSVSVGSRSFEGDEPNVSAHQLFHEADEKMYEDKGASQPPEPETFLFSRAS